MGVMDVIAHINVWHCDVCLTIYYQMVIWLQFYCLVKQSNTLGSGMSALGLSRIIISAEELESLLLQMEHASSGQS